VDSAGTAAGDYFFYSFNHMGSLTSLPAGSFGTSGITEAGAYFFLAFNHMGSLTSLPRSFRLPQAPDSVGSYYCGSMFSSSALIAGDRTVPLHFAAAASDAFKGTDITPASPGAGDTVYVNGDPDYPLPIHTVTFDPAGGTISPESAQRIHRAAMGALPVPVRAGHTFVGWHTGAAGGAEVTAATKVTADVTLFAHWRADSCTVALDTCGGVVSPSSVRVASGGAVGSLPVPARPRHAFLGWFTAASGGVQVTVATKVTADVTFFAHWEPAARTVSFDACGGTVSPLGAKVLFGAAIGALPTPTRPGHVFAGWFTAASGGTRVTAATAVTADATWYAHWTAKTYTVTFRGWDGRPLGPPQKVAHGAGAVAPDAPTRTGHTFVGWDRDFASVTADLTVTALYRAEACTVRLDASGGKVSGKAAASVKRAYGQTLGTLAKAVRTGYDFLGWYTGKVKGTKAGSATKVSRNVTYYAHWKAKGPVVTLNANGGKVGKAAATSKVYAKGKALGKLATPTRSGYTFLGWYTGKAKGTKVTAKTKATRNVTYYAHWKAKTYTVRLDAAGGRLGKAATSSLKKAHNAKLGKLAVPKRGGHSFLGWYTKKSGGEKVAAGTKVTKGVTLYAHWKRAR
jgi:uncharacterized repeat protein (TIGR02543 family)